MGRLVKCQWCGDKNIKSDDEGVTLLEHYSDSGKRYRKYFHDECLIKHQGKQEKLDDERDRLDDLVKMAGSVHNIPKNGDIPLMPRNWYHMIQDLRNGTQRYIKGMKIQKRYKKGVSYDIIKEAYRLSKDSIQWAKMSKQFRDDNAELRYGLAVVCNKLSDAVKSLERKEHDDKIAKAKEQQLIDQMKESERSGANLNKDKASYDISDFLD